MLGFFLNFDRQSAAMVVIVAVIAFLATSARRKGRRCPQCQENNRFAAIYCAQCGQKLPGR